MTKQYLIYVINKGFIKHPTTTHLPKEYVFTDNIFEAYEFNCPDDKKTIQIF